MSRTFQLVGATTPAADREGEESAPADASALSGRVTHGFLLISIALRAPCGQCQQAGRPETQSAESAPAETLMKLPKTPPFREIATELWRPWHAGY